MIILTVGGDTNDLSPNKRLHFWAQHERKRKWRLRGQIAGLGAIEFGTKPPQSRVRISFIIRRGRRLDPDNAASSGALKAIVDGLRDAGLLKNDTEQYCERGYVKQEPSKDYRRCPEVDVILEEIDA